MYVLDFAIFMLYWNIVFISIDYLLEAYLLKMALFGSAMFLYGSSIQAAFHSIHKELKKNDKASNNSTKRS